MYEGLVKSLRWLGFMFPETHPARDDADRISNNIHLYCTQAANAIEVLSKKEKTTQPDGRLTPKKPKVPVDTWVCPECGRAVEFQEMLGENIIFHGYHNFCPNCGQAIDWTEPQKEEAC